MEKEALDILLRGRQPVVVCPARSIEHARLPAAWRQPIEDGRLLVLSFFGQKERRATSERAAFRNECVAAIADRVLIVYAAPGGKTEALARKVRAWGKPLLCLEDEANAGLVSLGAEAVSPFTPFKAAT